MKKEKSLPFPLFLEWKIFRTTSGAINSVMTPFVTSYQTTSDFRVLTILEPTLLTLAAKQVDLCVLPGRR